METIFSKIRKKITLFEKKSDEFDLLSKKIKLDSPENVPSYLTLVNKDFIRNNFPKSLETNSSFYQEIISENKKYPEKIIYVRFYYHTLLDNIIIELFLMSGSKFQTEFIILTKGGYTGHTYIYKENQKLLKLGMKINCVLPGDPGFFAPVPVSDQYGDLDLKTLTFEKNR